MDVIIPVSDTELIKWPSAEEEREQLLRNNQARSEQWKEAEADFLNWPLLGTAFDGSDIRCHPRWGEGVFEPQSGMVISPIAYVGRAQLRASGIVPFGDK